MKQEETRKFYYDISIIKSQSETFEIEAQDEDEAVEKIDEVYQQFANGERDLDPSKYNIEINTEDVTKFHRKTEPQEIQNPSETSLPEVLENSVPQHEEGTQTFQFRVSKILATTIEVEAKSEDEAYERAQERYYFGNIDFDSTKNDVDVIDVTIEDITEPKRFAYSAEERAKFIDAHSPDGNDGPSLKFFESSKKQQSVDMGR